MKVKYFVVFHKNIHEECYQELTDEELKNFVFVAVNPSIEKKYPSDPKYNILKEWELPIYIPDLQQNNFKESSVIIHAYLNKLFDELDCIGFFQYDMYFKKGSLDLDFTKINCLSLHDFDMYIMNSALPIFSLQRLLFGLRELNLFDDTKFSIIKNVYPLGSTFILPVNFYKKVAEYAWFIIKNGVEFPLQFAYNCGYNNAIYMEYVFGIIISIFAKTEGLEMYEMKEKLIHDSHLKI
jgi:hypothetical protein